MKRFIPTVSQKSAEGKVGHAVGKDMEALQGRKAEQPIGRAGNDDRRPERYPARGIKGKASEQRDLRDDRRQKKNQYCLALRRQVGVKPRGASRKGPNRLLATHYAESLATSHLAQPAEPPYADPHVRWCGRGGRATVPPIPIACAGEAKKKTDGRKLPAVSWGNTTTKTTGLFLQSANESYHVANLLFGEFAIKRRHPVLPPADDGEE